jgi:hypothetical protein
MPFLWTVSWYHTFRIIFAVRYYEFIILSFIRAGFGCLTRMSPQAVWFGDCIRQFSGLCVLLLSWFLSVQTVVMKIRNSECGEAMLRSGVRQWKLLHLFMWYAHISAFLTARETVFNPRGRKIRGWLIWQTGVRFYIVVATLIRA